MLLSVCLIAPNWWLAKMAEMSHDQQKALITQAIHASLVAVSIVVMAVSSFFFTYTLLKAAENLHNKMTLATIKAPVLFFDTNPAGRIQNRFSKDVGCMDDVLPLIFLHALYLACSRSASQSFPLWWTTGFSWLFFRLLCYLVILHAIIWSLPENWRGLRPSNAVLCTHTSQKQLKDSK